MYPHLFRGMHPVVAASVVLFTSWSFSEDRIREALRNGKPNDAIVELRKLEKSDGFDSSSYLLEISRAFYRNAEFRKSLDLLEEIVRRYPNTRIHVLAQVAMGEVYQELGDERKMVAAYERAIDLPRTPTRLHLMDASDTNNRAYEALGDCYMKHRKWQSALPMWTAWKPQSWCGTCWASMERSRKKSIALCQLHLGSHRAAANTLLEGYFHGALGQSSSITLMLIHLYSQAGQIEDLGLMMSDYEAAWLANMKDSSTKSIEELMKYSPTRTYREFVQISKWAAEKDVAKLITVCQKTGRSSVKTFDKSTRFGQCRMAATGLANCDGEEVEQIEEALARGQGCKSWLIYALGRSESPQSEFVLERLARRVNQYDAENVAYAIWLKGERGREMLHKIANGRKYQISWLAKKWLKLDHDEKATWPPVQENSLPETFTSKDSQQTIGGKRIAIPWMPWTGAVLVALGVLWLAKIANCERQNLLGNMTTATKATKPCL